MITLPRVRWLEFLFMPLVLAIIIVAWFNPAVAWFMRATGPDRLAAVPAPLWMAGVILASTFVTRYVLTLKVKHPRLFIVGSGLAAIIVTAAVSYRGPSLMNYFRDLLDWGEAVSPEFVVLIAAAALWWRGILIGRSQSLVEENLERTFFNGIVALALLLYFNHLDQLAGDVRSPGGGPDLFCSVIGGPDGRQHRAGAPAAQRSGLSIQPALDRHPGRRDRGDFAGRNGAGRYLLAEYAAPVWRLAATGDQRGWRRGVVDYHLHRQPRVAAGRTAGAVDQGRGSGVIRSA